MAGEDLKREIKRRQNSEQSLGRALQEWQKTFDVIRSPILVLDTNLQVQKVNRAALQLFGQKFDLIGKKCSDIFFGDSEPCNRCKGDRQIPDIEIEHKLLGKTLQLTCEPVIYEEEVTAYVLTAIDLTEKRDLEKQLIQVQKMEAIATLAHGIAHDFNNILGAIMGNADLLLFRLAHQNSPNPSIRSEKLSAEEIVEHLAAIKKSGLRAKDLVDQILAFGRQSSSGSKNIDITPIVKEVVKLLRSSLSAMIEIKTNINSNSRLIKIDPTLIHQILMNLGTNAAHAMEKDGGFMTISLQEKQIEDGEESLRLQLESGDYLILSVTDTGQGMSKQVLDRAFDPFFTTKGVGKGTGMGLSVIHGIVTAQKGIIDLHTDEEKGTNVDVYLPCIKSQVQPVDMNGMDIPEGTENILFVDDDEDIVRMRTRMLQFLGYSVIAATSGEQALMILGRDPSEIDVVITDLTMPKMNGLDLTKKLRKIKGDLPVILCSGYSDPVHPDKIKESGVKMFLSKPLEMRPLAKALREVLDDQG